MKNQNQENVSSFQVYTLNASLPKGCDRATVTLSETLQPLLVVKNLYVYLEGDIYFPSVGEWTFSKDYQIAFCIKENGQWLWGVAL